MNDHSTTIDAPAGNSRSRKNDALLFAGIPYAQAPIDNLRFKPPQPLAPFSDTFAALKFSPAAPRSLAAA